MKGIIKRPIIKYNSNISFDRKRDTLPKLRVPVKPVTPVKAPSSKSPALKKMTELADVLDTRSKSHERLSDRSIDNP